VDSGTNTTKRPGIDTSWVSRAPFIPIGFFVTWQTIVWPGRRQVLDPISAGLALDVVALVGNVTPVKDAFFGVPMSTKAASMPGSTFFHSPGRCCRRSGFASSCGRATKCSMSARPSRTAMWVAPSSTCTHMEIATDSRPRRSRPGR